MSQGPLSYGPLSESLRFLRQDTEGGMFKVSIKEEFCTGCFACVKVCGSQVLGAKRVNENKKAYVRNEDNCVGCNKCNASCLTKAIGISRR